MTYYDPKSAKEAVMELHCTEIDGMALSVSQATVHDLKNTFQNPSYPSSTIGNGGSRRAFSAGSTFNGTFTSSFNGTGHKKIYNYASGHRATCGVGPKPYGLSAASTAEPYDPLRKGPTSPRSPSSSFPPSSSGLLEISPGIPLVIYSVSHPVPQRDPTKLTIQNVPLELDASTLYTELNETINQHHGSKSSSSSSSPQQPNINITEATLTYDEDRKKSMGIAFVAFENKEQASFALKILNGNYLLGYEEADSDGVQRMPLRAKVFELGGFVEKGLNFQAGKVDEKGLENGGEKNPTKESDDPQATVNAESIEQTTPTSPPIATTLTPAQISKYRKLLSTALDDLFVDEKKSLFRSEREKARLLDLLLERLLEIELKRCIFEEDHLKLKCETLKESY